MNLLLRELKGLRVRVVIPRGETLHCIFAENSHQKLLFMKHTSYFLSSMQYNFSTDMQSFHRNMTMNVLSVFISK